MGPDVGCVCGPSFDCNASERNPKIMEDFIKIFKDNPHHSHSSRVPYGLTHGMNEEPRE